MPNTRSSAPRCTDRYLTISWYGSASVSPTARSKWHRNGTSGIAPASPSTSPAAAIVIAPPWLPPVTATRAGSTWGRPRSTPTAQTASMNTRR